MKNKDTKNVRNNQELFDPTTEAKRSSYNYSYIKPSNIKLERSNRTKAISFGGIALVLEQYVKTGLARLINKSLQLLAIYQPYTESDHILNLILNIYCGGSCLEDIKKNRLDPVFLAAVGSNRLPDATTAGDFLRRFSSFDVRKLIRAVNTVSQEMWYKQPKEFRRIGIIDIDGTIEEVLGECKQGADFSYKNIYGYAPLVLSLRNTREVLSIENRPGNTHSCFNAEYHINRAIDLVKGPFKSIYMRGDTAYSLTSNFDKWDDKKVKFVFGLKKHKKYIELAEKQGNNWELLSRPASYEIKTKPRRKPTNEKEQKVIERGYKNQKLNYEEYKEFLYQPEKCNKEYRIVALKKHINVREGQKLLFEEIRYFFYITNFTNKGRGKKHGKTADEVIYFANKRCDHENDIEQLRNGVKAFNMPTRDLISNWAYMTIASIAWNMKAWAGMMCNNKNQRHRILKMEFKRYLREFIFFPAQIIANSGRRLVYRIIGYIKNYSLFENIFLNFQSMKL